MIVSTELLSGIGRRFLGKGRPEMERVKDERESSLSWGGKEEIKELTWTLALHGQYWNMMEVLLERTEK